MNSGLSTLQRAIPPVAHAARLRLLLAGADNVLATFRSPIDATEKQCRYTILYDVPLDSVYI